MRLGFTPRAHQSRQRRGRHVDGRRSRRGRARTLVTYSEGIREIYKRELRIQVELATTHYWLNGKSQL